MTVNLIDQPGFPRLKASLIALTGLAYYEDRDRELAAIVSQRLSELGVANCGAYLTLLNGNKDPAAERRDVEIDILCSKLTIGETYFFRDRNQFEALRVRILPEIIKANQSRRTLSIWSAGCSTGAEPYSVAILLASEFQHELAGWQVKVLGTDIDSQALERGRAGRFTDWHFRVTPEALKRIYCCAVDKEWEVLPEFRKWISFEKHNLVHDPFPAEAFDLILCRNVAIYFSRGTTQRLIAQFAGSLNADGWLMLGSGELAGEHLECLRPVLAGEAMCYRKHLAQTADDRGTKIIAAKRDVAEKHAAASARTGQSHPAPPAEDIEAMRNLADRGDWEQAGRYGRALVENQSLNPLSYLYYALVLAHRGDRDEAEAQLRKAISIDSRCVLAHYHLGLLLLRDARQAVHSFEKACTLLADMPEGHIFMGADGITAAELGAAIRIQLDALYPGKSSVETPKVFSRQRRFDA